MDEAKKKILHNLIAEKKADTETVLGKKYRMIAKKAVAQSPEYFVQYIVQEESACVTEHIRKLKQELKSDSVEAMLEIGLSESMTSIVWGEVMQVVGIPKPSLCQKRDIQVKSSVHLQNEKEENDQSYHRKLRKELEQLEDKRTRTIGITTTAVAFTAISNLIVPGWSGMGCVVKGVGILATGTGAMKIVETQKQIEEINRIIEEAKKATTSQNTNVSHEEQDSDMIQQICRHQYKMNCKIIHQWLDVVEKELIMQCEKELES